MTKEDVGELAIKFFTRWAPEDWVDSNTPAFHDAKRMRLAVAKFKREERLAKKRAEIQEQLNNG